MRTLTARFCRRPRPANFHAIKTPTNTTKSSATVSFPCQLSHASHSLSRIKFVAAHGRHTLACLALTLDGTRLATASDKGTIVRIFNTAVRVSLPLMIHHEHKHPVGARRRSRI